MSSGVDKVLVLVGHCGEVLEGDPAILGLRERSRGGPLVGCWQGTEFWRLLGRHHRRGEGEEGKELHLDFDVREGNVRSDAGG